LDWTERVRRRLPDSLLGTARHLRQGTLAFREARALAPVLEEVRGLTMVEQPALLDVARHVRSVVTQGIPGDFVECGVWRGGCAFLMARVAERLGAERTVWLCDSFEGLPQPEAVDGEAAIAWAEAKDPDNYYDNCRATLEEVQASADGLGLRARTRFVKGWFEESLPAARDEIASIALLRVDADWYSSVRCCLDNLYDLVSDGGIVVLDDYYAWDGCALAVHEFLTERRKPHRIRQGEGTAYFRKQ
jgi:hypothetical protein